MVAHVPDCAKVGGVVVGRGLTRQGISRNDKAESMETSDANPIGS